MKSQNTAQPKQKFHPAKSGMTLIETVIALALLVLSFAGAFRAYFAATTLYQSAKNLETATQIAQSRLERIEQVNYSDLFLWGNTNQVVNDRGTPANNGQFRISTEIAPGSATNQTDITVLVSFLKNPGEYTSPREFSISRFN